MLTFAPLIQMLLEAYSWRGSLLLVAGIVMNVFILSSLFRPPDKQTQQAIVDESIPQNPVLGGSMLSLALSRQSLSYQTVENPSWVLCNDDNSNLSQIDENDNVVDAESLHSDSLINSETSEQRRKTKSSYSDVEDIRSSVSQSLFQFNSDTKTQEQVSTISSNVDSLFDPASRTHKRTQCTSDVKHFPQENDERNIRQTCLHSIKRSDGFRIFSNFYVILLLFIAFLICGHNINVIYLPAKCQSVGLTPQEAALIISILGFTDTIGRPLIGCLGYKVDNTVLLTFTLFLMGIPMMINAFCVNFWSILITATISQTAFGESYSFFFF